ncbi:alpha/beta fold hydrolase [Speluncibacter jeojiensis]|uniref:alpha/beta fold hydrolase n=1 Tax=Speluncibacter jeojiensis TaxID=2710754 RepID=UPI0024107A92|nr:alpha/beta hydrolase [Rhodococcus sp. D2-41]
MSRCCGSHCPGRCSTGSCTRPPSAPPTPTDRRRIRRWRLVNGFIPDRDAALPALELGRAVVHESEHDFLADLSPSAVHCPMTIVHGTKDRLVPVAASRRLHELVPGSTLVVLPGVGHCPQLDVPGEVTRLALNLRP